MVVGAHGRPKVIVGTIRSPGSLPYLEERSPRPRCEPAQDLPEPHLRTSTRMGLAVELPLDGAPEKMQVERVFVRDMAGVLHLLARVRNG